MPVTFRGAGISYNTPVPQVQPTQEELEKDRTQGDLENGIFLDGSLQENVNGSKTS